MKQFEYTRAGTVEDAVTLAGVDSAAYLGGGTNLVDHLRLGITHPDRLVDVSRIDFGGIEAMPDGGLRVGAGVRNADLAAHPLVRQRFPFVSEALLAGASGQIRSMATTAGNLLQRTRCVYFQDVTTPCNKRDPGTGCSAREGFGRYNAVLGQSDACVAVNPSDLCVPLAALDASVLVTGPHGDRAISFLDLHRLPGDEPWRDTTLEPGELVTAIELPGLPWATRSQYRKVRDRASYAFALVSVAAAIDVDGGVMRDVRLALGGVSHRPHRALTAEAAMRGRPASREVFAEAIDAELEPAQAGEENAYKLPLLRRTVAAVLADLAEGNPR